VKGRTVSVENAASFEVDDWPVVRFQPRPAQLGGALGLIGAGLLATALIGRLGGEEPDAPQPGT
jgi:hypothetical protein